MTRNAKNSKGSNPARRGSDFFFLFIATLAFGYFFSSCSKPENKDAIVPTESAAVKQPEFSPVPVIDPNADFSTFRHTNAEHARFPCALCHERKDNSPTPKFSAHLPCAGCHVAQFADNKSAICTICHTNPTETAALKSFPALKSFNVVFDHAKHLGQTNCATCHKPARGGVAQSIPAGLSAHNTCFVCHSPGAKSGENNIDSCSVCHQTGKSAKVSDWAQTFETTPFTHAKHKLECAVCHTVKAGAGRGRQVTTALVARMHFPPSGTLSCASCHNNKRAFGGDDFQDCRRCHRGNNFKFS